MSVNSMSNSHPEVSAIHIASSPIDGRQHCRSCGRILIDRTQESRPAEQQESRPAEEAAGVEVWFKTGGWVRVTPEGMYAERSLAPEDQRCIRSKEVNPCL